MDSQIVTQNGSENVTPVNSLRKDFSSSKVANCDRNNNGVNGQMGGGVGVNDNYQSNNNTSKRDHSQVSSSGESSSDEDFPDIRAMRSHSSDIKRLGDLFQQFELSKMRSVLSTINDLQEKYLGIDNEANACKGNYEKIDNQFSLSRRKLLSLQKSLTDENVKLDEIKLDCTSRKDAFTKAKNKLDRTSKEQAPQKYASLKGTMESLGKEIEVIKYQIEKLEQTISTLTSNIEDTKKEIAGFEQQSNDCQTLHSQLLIEQQKAYSVVLEAMGILSSIVEGKRYLLPQLEREEKESICEYLGDNLSRKARKKLDAPENKRPRQQSPEVPNGNLLEETSQSQVLSPAAEVTPTPSDDVNRTLANDTQTSKKKRRGRPSGDKTNLAILEGDTSDKIHKIYLKDIVTFKKGIARDNAQRSLGDLAIERAPLTHCNFLKEKEVFLFHEPSETVLNIPSLPSNVDSKAVPLNSFGTRLVTTITEKAKKQQLVDLRHQGIPFLGWKFKSGTELLKLRQSKGNQVSSCQNGDNS